MKVAYVSFAPFVSGAERSLQVMINAAPQVGIEPMVLCPPGSKILDWCVTHGIHHVAVKFADRDKRHPLRWLASVARLAGILRRERVDVVHSNQVWSFAAIGAAAGCLGIPRVCHMRDEVSVAAARWCCKPGVEAVICISRHIEQQVAPAWTASRNPPRLLTLLNPVAEPVYSDAPSTETTRRFGRVSDTRVFGFIGQIVAVKGVLELIDALSGLSDDPRWHLLIAGRDPHPGQPYEMECRRRVEALGLAPRVTFLGFLEDVRAFYEAIDVAVVPSLEEPLGRVPLEAASYGKSTVAFATGGLPETIEHGTTGWLVATGDVQGLRGALRQVLDDPGAAARAGILARNRVKERHAPDRYMREVAGLYRDLLSSGTSAHAAAS